MLRRASSSLPLLLTAALIATLLPSVGCLPMTNAYDPNAPLELQARASVSGGLQLAYTAPTASIVEARLKRKLPFPAGFRIGSLTPRPTRPIEAGAWLDQPLPR